MIFRRLIRLPRRRALVASYSFTVAIALLAVIYLIDIIATYLLIPEKKGAPRRQMQCDSQEFCCRTMAWRYCIRSRDGYIIAAGEIQVIEPPFSVRPVTNGGPSSFLRVHLQ
jgi:hypothetical protein